MGLCFWSRYSKLAIDFIDVAALEESSKCIRGIFRLKCQTISFEKDIDGLLSRKGVIVTVGHLCTETVVALENPLRQRRAWVAGISHHCSV